MDKLVEREAGARNPLSTAPAIAVQFFLIPLLVVGATVLVYIGFRGLLSEDRSAEEYLTDIRSGGSNRRWPAAYELSRLMADPEFVKREEAMLAPELTKAFAESKNDDPQGAAVSRVDAGPADAAASRRDAAAAGRGAERQGQPDAHQRDLGARIDRRGVGRGRHRAAVPVRRRRRSQDGGLRAGVDAGR